MGSDQNMVPEEAVLLQRVKADKQAFLQIYDRYFQQIYNYIFYRLFQQDDAEELTAQTFLAALENIDHYEYRNIPIIVWLYRIASHLVIDFYRHQGKVAEYVRSEIESGIKQQFSTEEIYWQQVKKEQLGQQLQELPSSQREAIILRYYHELSYREIAFVMEKTEGAIKQLLHRGLKNLRERMVGHE